MSEDYPDEFEDTLAREMENPAFARYYRRALNEHTRVKWPVPIKPSLRRPMKRGVPRG